ncbi:phospholipid-translocating P-type ATPase [Jaminaea rosea]|uniref:Phospholipid-transporting ATPase n=1 Tax=Jaminaea rosea TaxID=1569628 RepID=A0A316UXC2_9BASI|nr:phospholipid-translocating P-type ATPase [Jaminaea rosea]PWN29959.1 phospholipid-translocating P-type ATPase [Jaminaea rosea]
MVRNPFKGRDQVPEETPEAMGEPNKFVQAWRKVRAVGLDPELLFQKTRPPPAPRTIFFNEPLPAEYFDHKGKPLKSVTYATNQVLTAKYTVYNFIPKNLFEQFRRVANIFFLILVILQFFPKFATINPVLAMLPLLAVLAITALKDGYEDVKRHQSDRYLNRQQVRVMTAHNWINPNVMEEKERSVSAIWNGLRYKWLGGKKKQSQRLAKEFERRQASAAQNPEAVVGTPRASTADGPGGPAPETLPTTNAAAPGHHRSASDAPSTPGLGHTLSRASTSFGGPNRSSTMGVGSMYEGYETTPEGRVMRNGVLLTPEEETKYHAKKAPRWKKNMWEDLRVGDFVLIKNDEPIPADVIICATSEEEDSCFIETKNLDGETNLKSRHAVPELATMIRTAGEAAQAAMRVDSEPQDTNMYRLNASVTLADRFDQEGNPMRCPVTLNQILLRGCNLRNTKWVVGLVLMTGVDTKIIANSGNTPSKRSRVERQMNPMVYVNLLILACMAVGCAIADSLIEVHYFGLNAYWEFAATRSDDNPRINGLVTFGNALITFQNIVPISLYISIEVVRTIQAYFIFDDAEIYYEKTNRRTTARSWNLSDDLGQIQYIFSDKTGTLTQNLMLFRECAIGGVVYRGDPGSQQPQMKASGSADHSLNEKAGASSPSGTDVESGSGHEAGGKTGRMRVKPSADGEPFKDAQLQNALKDPHSTHGEQLGRFWRCLALCHTALASTSDGMIDYKAQSPDEQALVQAAAETGFVFLGRDRSTLSLQVPGSSEIEKYELLSVLEFTSARKRMSVILRRHADSKILVLSKGADSIIFERSAAGQDDIKANTDEALEEFANKGLRTLCLAGKELTEESYNEWAFRYHDASVALERREEKMEDLASELERDFLLYGATAIEDRLQDGVPETIADLKRAGINVWVATGDKLETAIAIGYSTQLLAQDMNLIVVRGGEYGAPNSAYEQLKRAVERFFGGHEALAQMKHQPPDSENERRNSSRFSLGGRPSLQGRRSHSHSRSSISNQSLVGADNGQRAGGYALVIDGTALGHALSEDFSKDLLLSISTQCKAVICCRVSPLQKALIVRLIKDGLGVMTLAIGDGANDVSMIQAAHVGIGIAGEEGLQAVNSSDYAIAQFRFLKRLLLVHGHWSYWRNGLMISNFFYKEIINISYLFFYQIYCAWSTTYALDYVYILLWNAFWTVAAVIGAGIFDRPISDRILMEVPELYRRSRENRYFGLTPFGWCMIDGVYQGVVMLFFILYTYNVTSARGDGYDVPLYEWSTVIAYASVLCANLFTGINVRAYTWWMVFAIALGPILFNIFAPVYAAFSPTTIWTYSYGNNQFLYPSFLFWMAGIFAIVLALLPRVIFRFVQESYYPNDIDILRYVDKRDPNHDYVHDPNMPTMRSRAKYAEGNNGNVPGGAPLVPASSSEHHHRLYADQEAGEGGTGALDPPNALAMHELRPTQSRASSRHYDMLTGTDRPSRGYSFSHEDLPPSQRPGRQHAKRGGTLRRLLMPTIPGSLKRRGSSMKRNKAQREAAAAGAGAGAGAAGAGVAASALRPVEDEDDDDEQHDEAAAHARRGPENDVEEEADPDPDSTDYADARSGAHADADDTNAEVDRVLGGAMAAGTTSTSR